MSTEVVMPQMGESIAEGTVVKWIKKVGEQVQRDEPLFEISTDKVDAEIPSPTTGILLKILATEGQTVPVNTVVAILGESSEEIASEGPKEIIPEVTTTSIADKKEEKVTELGSISTVEMLRKTRSSPLVRKIARENNIDISEITGTGLSGRVTKQDILSYVDSRQVISSVATPSVGIRATSLEPVSMPIIPAYSVGERIETVPMSPMRKKISEHMIASRRTSAHVSSVFEIDMTQVVQLREKARKRFEERSGVKLTFMPFIITAVVEGLKAFPIMNSSVDGDNIIYKKDINIGIAVALDWGLIVPVVKQADEKNLLGLAKSVNDLATRARSKQLKPDEVAGGTFTITNPGVFGSLFGAPIINQPQVAIMGVGAIVKRPMVMPGDAIAIRSMVYFSISFDHRIIDGAVADQFMASVKATLEGFKTTELD